MNDSQLPTGPADEDPARLPARKIQDNLPAHSTPRPQALELLRDDAAGNPDEIDLLAYWRILLKRRRLVLGIAVTTTTIALLMALTAPAVYRATATIKIEKARQQIVPGEAMDWSGRDPQFLTTQLGLLTSRSLAERVATDLDLNSEDLARLQAPGWLDRLKQAVSPPPAAPTKETPSASVEPRSTEADRELAASWIRDGLSVFPQPDSRLVNINFDSPSPHFSALAANAVADGYIASDLERRFGASSYATTYLEEQLRLTKSRLEDSERALVKFAQKENLVTTNEGQSLAGQNLSNLNASLAEAQAQRIRSQARWAQLQSTNALPQDMLGISLVPTLRQQRAELQRQYQEKLKVFKPDYPQMQQLQGQIDEMDRQIDAEIGNVRRSVKAEYDAALAQEALLKGQLASLRTETLDTDSRSIQYNILKREVDTNRELYDGLLQRYKQVGVSADMRTDDISIIDRALVPGYPYRPNRPMYVFAGLVAGLMLGALMAFVLEFLDDTLKTPEDVEEQLRLAVLGIIPNLGARDTVEAASRDLRSAFSESYRSVRTALQFSTDQGVPKVLLVTSPGPGEGKSTSALTLARNFGQLGRRVLLIEADLRNPSLHKSLRMRSDKGLSNVLAGACTLTDAAAPSGEPRVDVLLAGPLPPNPAELLSGARLVSLLRVAANEYDQVVIDGPPVMGIADGPLLANAADATLLVVRSGHSRIKSAQAAAKRLYVARARLIGALLTRYDARAAGYDYQYEGYYAYGAPQLTGSKR